MLADKLRAASLKGAEELNYVEDVFSTYLYTGNGSTQTITNGIDLSTKGGLVWIKSRSATTSHFLFDTDRGALNEINSDTTNAQASLAASLTAFNTTGFDLGAAAGINVSAATYVSWTFRKQAKFFDVVTYTGNGSSRTITHNLGSVPGCIMVKRTDTTGDWKVYHRSLTSAAYFVELNTADSESTTDDPWNSTAPTSSVFSLGTAAEVNASGGTYVAYLFAHDASGFGDLGTNNIISCGSYTGNGSTTGPIVTLGWEPQWILAKSVGSGNWFLIDSTRCFSAGLIASTTHNAELAPNSNAAELSEGFAIPRADGFQIYGGDGANAKYNSTGVNYIYIAIRRGPMRAPTSGSDVLTLVDRIGTGANATVPATKLTDIALIKNRFRVTVTGAMLSCRITNNGHGLTTSTTAEATFSTVLQARAWDVIGGVKVGTTSVNTNASGESFINYLISRAPKFSDTLSYIFPSPLPTSPAEIRIPHNLTIKPEMIVVKSRTSSLGWYVYHKDIGRNAYVRLNVNNTQTGATGMWGAGDLTDADFGVDPNFMIAAGGTAIFYLFATCPGVSKVGGYNGAGVGTPQQIDCGFTTGARFVLIKARNGIAGDWYLWDSTRGIVSGNDPYFLVNSGNAEVTTTDYIDTYDYGFELSADAPAALNNTGYSYIFLAIA